MPDRPRRLGVVPNGTTDPDEELSYVGPEEPVPEPDWEFFSDLYRRAGEGFK